MRKNRLFAALIVSVITAMLCTGVFAEPQTDTQTPAPSAGASDTGKKASEYASLPENLDYRQNIQKADEAKYLDTDIYMENSELDAPEAEHAQAAILMDLKSGRIIYGKNAKQRMFPASTTKIMTGILAIELCVEQGYKMDTVIEAPPEAILPITSEDSHMGILIGEELTVENLLYGLLVYSANDAANVLAVELAGSMNDFVKLMNDKAAELGMTGTNYVNVCGMHDDNHYTTAYDLSIIARYAMQNETFREIVKTPMYRMPATNKYKSERNLSNTNLFLSNYRSSYYNDPEHYTGIKTGHTEKAGYCLVTSAQHTPDSSESGEQIQLLSVVMKCDDKDVNDKAYSYIETKKLINFGFNNYQYISIHKAGDHLTDSAVTDAKNDTRVAITSDTDVYALLPKNTNIEDIDIKTDIKTELEAPIAKGDTLGTAEFSYSGKHIASVNLVAMNNVELNVLLYAYHKTTAFLFHPAVIIVIILLFILLIVLHFIKRANERKRRLRKLRGTQRRQPRTVDPRARSAQNRREIDNRKNSRSMYTKKK